MEDLAFTNAKIAILELLKIGVHDVVRLHPYKRYLDTLDIMVDLDDPNQLAKFTLANEPELKWYWNHFDHVPSIFLIGDIDDAGLTPGPDAFGVTYNMTFAWVVDTIAPWSPPEATTISHEVGHILGLGHTVLGLMGAIPGDLDDEELSAAQAAQIGRSPWLRRIPDPEPNDSP